MCQLLPDIVMEGVRTDVFRGVVKYRFITLIPHLYKLK